MDGVLLSLQDWVALTTVGLVILSPLYALVWRLIAKVSDLNEHLAVLSSIIKRCPYCNKDIKEYEVEDDFKFRRE